MANITGLINRVSASELYHMACSMDRGHNFGYNGWRAIGEYLENLSDDIGEPIEVDIVGICCDYSKANSVGEWWEENGEYSTIDADEWEEAREKEKLELIRDYLEDRTSVVCCDDDCIIWQAF
jgi:hypothetical protein